MYWIWHHTKNSISSRHCTSFFVICWILPKTSGQALQVSDSGAMESYLPRYLHNYLLRYCKLNMLSLPYYISVYSSKARHSIRIRHNSRIRLKMILNVKCYRHRFKNYFLPLKQPLNLIWYYVSGTLLHFHWLYTELFDMFLNFVSDCT